MQKKPQNIKKLEVEYKNYRSNYLIIWLLVNMSIASAIQISYNRKYQWAIWGFLILVVALTIIQLFFTLIFVLKD